MKNTYTKLKIMEKAKLMLSALLVIVIIGIFCAFKTNRFIAHFIYTGTLGSGCCLTKVNGAAISTGTPNVAASASPMCPRCPDRFTTAVAD